MKGTAAGRPNHGAIGRSCRPAKSVLDRWANLTDVSTHDGAANLRIGDLAVDAASRSIVRDGRSVHLTGAEFNLLWYLATNTGRVISRDELFDRLLGVEYNGLDRTIDVRVSRLRRKLESEAGMPRLIQSVRSEGYCLAVNPRIERAIES